jgi:hypothetical protein
VAEATESENVPDPLAEPIMKQFKGIILPYWVQYRMARDKPWDDLNEKDFLVVQNLWYRVFGKAPPYKIKRDTEIFKKVRRADHIIGIVSYVFIRNSSDRSFGITVTESRSKLNR